MVSVAFLLCQIGRHCHLRHHFPRRVFE